MLHVWNKIFLLGFIFMSFSNGHALDIITIDTPQADILKKTKTIFHMNFRWLKRLPISFTNHFPPISPQQDSAAPQIGISKSKLHL